MNAESGRRVRDGGRPGGRLAALAILAMTVCMMGCIGPRLAAPAMVTAGPRLYVLDCGTIDSMGAEMFGLSANEIHGDGSFVTPCYLVVHPKGTLLWEVGQVTDAAIPEDGSGAVAYRYFRATRRLSSQLAELGYQPADIDYLAMSHHHADHSANANAFAGSAWIVQQAEYDAMFSDAAARREWSKAYADLKTAKRIVLNNADHDVFGDGTVIIKTAPGHTPGHQVLFLKLRHFGPLLLMGDLYHFPEQKALDRVPTFDFDGAMTRASRRSLDQFIERTGAQAWIQHDPVTYRTIRKSPAAYD